MPPKNCARCQKIVYPTEELKCLDVVWHKLCFKCEECGMSLNVKTFKAFEKKPYCPAHVPKLQATFVADTPEARRLAENSKIQSQVKYHEEFEKSKGTRTAVTDDPEMQRIRQNTAIQSGVAYKGIQQQRDLMEQKRPTEREIDDVAEISQQLAHSRIMGPPQPVPLYTNGHSNGSNGHQNHQYQQQPPNGYTNGYHQQPKQNGCTNGHTNYANGTYSPPDSISPPSDRSNGGGYYSNGGAPAKIYSHEDASQPIQQQQRKVGSIADYDPVNGQWGTIAGQAQQQPQYQPPPQQYQSRGPQPFQTQSPPQMASPGSQPQHQQQRPVQQQQQQGVRYRAMYDYEAMEEDECTFFLDDMITNVRRIDDGWVVGTVQRTGRTGMIPANYIEPCA